MVEFILNDQKVSTNKPSGSLLLDYVRYHKNLTGTKIGCREGDCGACTVLIGELKHGQMEYEQVTSCLTPIGNVQGKHVVTVEGLNMEDLSPVQQYMVNEAGTQCGFCTVGFVVSLTGFCLANKDANYKEAIAAIDGNICRCTGYRSIERAAQHITDSLAGKDTKGTVQWLVERNFIPAYFKGIPELLSKIIPKKDPKQMNVLVGGGTDLYVQKHLELINQEVGLITDLPELRFIRVKDRICTLGGGTTVSDMIASAELHSMFPQLDQHMKLVSSSPIRNISTLAGNFVNASPIGDMTAIFLALNAKITLYENGTKRTIYLKDFYKGYKDLDKTEKEVISNISFDVPKENSYFNFEKVSKRIHLDIASVNSAALLSVSNTEITMAHISAGGVGPIPTYLSKTCEFLIGNEVSAENIQAANDIMQSEISPISDVRGTEAYKRLLLRQFFYAHFIQFFPERITLKALI